jgi:hypothetical protein
MRSTARRVAIEPKGAPVSKVEERQVRYERRSDDRRHRM